MSTLADLLTKANISLNDNEHPGVSAFGPLNSGFTALPSLVVQYLSSPQGGADLEAVLKLHVVPSVIYSDQLAEGQTVVPTLSGEVRPRTAYGSGPRHFRAHLIHVQNVTVTVNGTNVSVSNANSKAQVVTFNELASNGVAHVIDQVEKSSLLFTSSRSFTPCFSCLFLYGRFWCLSLSSSLFVRALKVLASLTSFRTLSFGSLLHFSFTFF